MTGNIGSSSRPLDEGYLTSRIPGEDRRAPQNTIDETVWETLRRDLLAVWAKLREVLYPRYLLGGSMFDGEGGFRGAYSNLRGAGFSGTREELTGLASRAVDADALLGSSLSPGLRDWDLWGPLIFCLLLSMLLSFSPRAQPEQKDAIFSGVFAMIWLGEAIVTLQIRLLGGSMYVECILAHSAAVTNFIGIDLLRKAFALSDTPCSPLSLLPCSQPSVCTGSLEYQSTLSLWAGLWRRV